MSWFEWKMKAFDEFNSANVFLGLCLAVTYRNLKSGSRAPSGSFRLISRYDTMHKLCPPIKSQQPRLAVCSLVDHCSSSFWQSSVHILKQGWNSKPLTSAAEAAQLRASVWQAALLRSQ